MFITGCLDLCFAISIMSCWFTKTNNIIKISKYILYILLTSVCLVHSFPLGPIWSILVYSVQFGLLSPFIFAQSILVQQCQLRSFRSTMVHSITSIQFDPLWSTPSTLVHSVHLRMIKDKFELKLYILNPNLLRKKKGNSNEAWLLIFSKAR